MKDIKWLLMTLVAVTFCACSEEDLDANSIFDSETVVEQNDFDKWLLENYTTPYNINFKYRFIVFSFPPFFDLLRSAAPVARHGSSAGPP